MCKAVAALALATSLVAAPVVQAQDRALPARDLPTTESTLATAAPATAAPVDKGRSGFGQVMRVLTDLLQEAARQQASATREDAFSSTLSGDDSAVTIRVTPVAGRSSFHAPKAKRGTAAQSAAGAAMTLDASPRTESGLAVQGGGSP